MSHLQSISSFYRWLRFGFLKEECDFSTSASQLIFSIFSFFPECPSNSHRTGRVCDCDKDYEKVGNECSKSESVKTSGMNWNAWKIKSMKIVSEKISTWGKDHRMFLFADCPTNSHRKGTICECNIGFEKVGNECLKSESFEEYFKQVFCFRIVRFRLISKYFMGFSSSYLKTV